MSELLADARIAGLLADQAELPQSKRVRWGTKAHKEVAKLLAADIMAVKQQGEGGVVSRGRPGQSKADPFLPV